jgi:hypothetical protein
MLDLFVAFMLHLPSVNETPEVLADQVAAAQNAASEDLPVELLLAVGYFESHYQATATSVLINGVRRTGPWRSTRRPKGQLASLHCGVTQATARTWAECLQLRDPDLAYIALADSLARWLVRAKGNIKRVLDGYGCGNRGFRTGRCNRYPARVLHLMRRLQNLTAGAV